MKEPWQILATLGSLLLMGLFTDALGKRTRLPRVTLLLLFGIALGPSGLSLMPNLEGAWFTTVANMTLVMVGFLLGGKLTLTSLRLYGRGVLFYSLGVTLGTILLVGVGLKLLGVPWSLVLLFAGIAPATAPAATMDVVHETGAKGPFSSMLLGIVAVDDLWGLLAFSLFFALAQALEGGSGLLHVFQHGGWELGMSFLVGIGLGLPMAYLTGRLQPGEPTLVEALGFVLLCGGLAIWLSASFLLASVTMGVVVANRAKHHDRPFHAIEGIEWPFLVLFFVMAGASLHLSTLAQLGLWGTGYVLLRVGGRMVGAWLGGRIGNIQGIQHHWMGMALMPQAGVALGMALVASERFPQYRNAIFPVVIGATVLFELVGPLLTKLALVHAGEIPTGEEPQPTPQ
ncbi:MAG: cation:proton antiporter [Deltaproteobacteria bacterium]|nr:MAG: cation:proton antiporter [Deltaproteobacteria bacterium]